MVENEHLAPLGEPWEGEHPPDVAARDHSRGLYNALFVNAADEADLAPLSEANGSFDCDGNLGGETVGGHGWEYTEERPLTLLSGSSP